MDRIREKVDSIAQEMATINDNEEIEEYSNIIEDE